MGFAGCCWHWSLVGQVGADVVSEEASSLSSWSLILSGAREISPNESCREIGLLYGKASVLVNQQFLMKNLLSENSQEAAALTSERCLSWEHITGIYGALPWFIVPLQAELLDEL